MLLVFMHVLFPAGSGCGICQSMAHAVQFVPYVGCCAKQNDHHHHHHHLGKVGFLLGKVVFYHMITKLQIPTPNSNSQLQLPTQTPKLQLPTPTPNSNSQPQLPTPTPNSTPPSRCYGGVPPWIVTFYKQVGDFTFPQKHKKAEQTVVFIVTCSWYFECTFHENHNPSPSVITIITITIIIIITITQLSFKAQAQ